MIEPSVLIVVAIAIGLVLLAAWRRRTPSDPEAEVRREALDAERDRHKTESLEAVERSRHQWPPGGSG